MTTRGQRSRREQDEDAEIEDEMELPPLDDEGEDDRSREAPEELPLDLDDAGEGEDDSAAGELDVGAEIDALDEGEGGAEPEAELDVGPLDEDLHFDDQGERGGDHAEGEGDDDLSIDEPSDLDDGGAEGTSEDPEDEVDEAALPEIDDDDGDQEEDALADVLLAEADAALPPWGLSRWVPLEGAGAAVPCRSVAIAAGRVAAAGEVLLLVEEGARAARRLATGEGAIAVALADDALLAATGRGQLLVSRDGEAVVTSLPSWRAEIEAALHPAQLRGRGEGGPGSLELAATPDRFWIRAGGALLCMTSKELPLITVRAQGVAAIAASGGVLLAVTRGPSGPAIERFRGDDEGWRATPLSGAALHLAERGGGELHLAAAAGGRCLALGDGERVALSRDGGASFAAVELGPTSAIAFAGDDEGPPLLALVAQRAGVDPGVTSSGPAFLVELGAAGESARIAEIAMSEAPWAAAALGWDASREVVWVACGAGLVAFGHPRAH